MFDHMKRAFILFSVSIFLLRLPLMAQDATSNTSGNPAGTAAAIAAKEDAEERYKRLAADLQAVQSDNEALHAKITGMEEEIQTLRTAQAHSADNSGIQNDLKRLADSIQEVDKKRLEDKDRWDLFPRPSARPRQNLPPLRNRRPQTRATSTPSRRATGSI